MKRSAPTEMELLLPILDRWSPRAFSDRIPERNILLRVFEAARWAPSAFNEQPWRFILATRDDQAGFQKMLSCLMEINAVWASRAPVLAIMSTAKTYAKNGRENRHAGHDAGLALSQLILQATWEGLFVHPMAGFSSNRAREAYGIPDAFEPLTALALGYYGDVDDLSEELRKRELAPRERRPLDQTLFSESWGQPSPLVKR